MWGRRRVLPALVLAVTLAASSASAQGAVRLGPDLTPESGIPTGPNAGFAGVGCQKNFSPCSWINLRSTDATNPVAAPSDGVITRWSFRITCCGVPAIPGAHTLTLATFRQGTHGGDFGYAYAIPTGTPGPAFVVPDGSVLPVTPPTSLPVRMPIKAGERVGVVGDDAFFIPVYGPPGVTAASISNGSVDKGEPYGQAWPGVAWASTSRSSRTRTVTASATRPRTARPPIRRARARAPRPRPRRSSRLCRWASARRAPRPARRTARRRARSRSSGASRRRRPATRCGSSSR